MAELSLHDVRAGYGETIVLEDITLELPERGALAVLGRNGVGKTTLLATIMGHTTFHAGSIEYQGRSIAKLPVYELLGGKCREAVDTYRHASGKTFQDVEEAVASARLLEHRGYQRHRSHHSPLLPLPVPVQGGSVSHIRDTIGEVGEAP